MALKGKIRALREREGKSISEIARRTSLARNTIKEWLKSPADGAAEAPAAERGEQAHAIRRDDHAGVEERRTQTAALATAARERCCR